MAGMRTEPPISLPCAIAPRPTAVAAPAPPEEPPADTVGSSGFSVRPCNALSEKTRIEKAGRFVRPTMTPPAARSRATRAAHSRSTGGAACALYGDTWSYDGVDWTQLKRIEPAAALAR